MARWIVMALLLTMGAASPACADGLADATALPPGIKPLEKPLEGLRFRPVDQFAHAWGRWLMIGKRSNLVEAFEIHGTVKAQDDRLLWTYKLYNLGRDDKLQEWGEVEVLTDSWGKVEKAKILSDLLPKVPLKPGSFAYLDASNLDFPLCCLPHGPVSMGSRVDLARPDSENRASPDAPRVISDDRRSVVAGVQTKDGHRYLVLRHDGGMTLDIDGTRLSSVQTGYEQIDIDNGLPRFDIKSNANTLTTTLQVRKTQY